MKLEDIARYNTRVQLPNSETWLHCKLRFEGGKVFADDISPLPPAIPYGTLVRVYTTSRHCAGEVRTMYDTPQSATSIQLNPEFWKSYDEGFSTVGSLLNYAKTSPEWVGDDFNECLEDINRNRP